MSLKYLPIESITEAQLQSLVGNKVDESETLEYKEPLPGYNREETIEFLADVSSFANAAGGDIVYGIKEQDHVPVAVTGLGNITFDTERNRLEQKILSGIEPRIHGIRFRPVQLGTGGLAMIVRIPRSWASPHVVQYQGHWKFYRRGSGGKIQMDLADLRSAFELSGTTADRIRDFRAERIGSIIARDTPVTLGGGPAVVVLHAVPLSAVDSRVKYDLAGLSTAQLHSHLRLFGSIANNSKYNFDGVVLYSGDAANSSTYAQLFRNGCIEAATTGLMHHDHNPPLIAGKALEERLTAGVANFLRFQQTLGVEPPLLVLVTLTGVRGYTMEQPSPFDFGPSPQPIDRDALVVPDVLVEGFDAKPADVLKPVFEVIWNAAGYGKSPYS